MCRRTGPAAARLAPPPDLWDLAAQVRGASPSASSRASSALSDGDDASDGVLTGVPSRRWPLDEALGIQPHQRTSGELQCLGRALAVLAVCHGGAKAGLVLRGVVSRARCGVGASGWLPGHGAPSRRTGRRRPGPRPDTRAADDRAGGLAVGPGGWWLARGPRFPPMLARREKSIKWGKLLWRWASLGARGRRKSVPRRSRPAGGRLGGHRDAQAAPMARSAPPGHLQCAAGSGSVMAVAAVVAPV